MIKNILIPEKLGSYYIFQKRIVGFDIDKTHVTATQVYLKGKTVTIERCLDEILDTGNELTYEEKVTKAIKNIVNSLDKFDEVYTSISSLNVIFKSLRLPFVKYEKIKSVINYEVEPLLPFAANQALIDFVITKEIPSENSSEVMVAAVQENTVQEHVKMFTDAGISPSKVVVDLLALYSFYKNIPEYENILSSVVLIDVGFNLTRLSFINNGQIIFVRTFPKGIFSQAKDLAKIYSITQNEAAEMIMRYGYQKEDDPKYKQAIEPVASNFWSDIRFTIQSFTSKLPDNLELSKVLILGQGAKIDGITEFVGNFLSVDCQLFRTASLTNNPNVLIKNSLTIPSSNIISLATVFPSVIMDKFNLYKSSQDSVIEKLILKQIIFALFCIIIIVTMLFVNNYIKISKLKAEIESSEQEAIEKLRKAKFKISETENTLDEAITSATTQIEEKKKYFGFIGKDRFSFLRNLLALKDAIDLEGTGIKVSKLTISQPDESMILSAEVRDFDALNKLTRDIRARKDSFSHVKPVSDKKFEMKIELAKKI